MIKILCVELFEATFTHSPIKYTITIKLETFLPSLLYQTHLRNSVNKVLYLLEKEYAVCRTRTCSLLNDES